MQHFSSDAPILFFSHCEMVHDSLCLLPQERHMLSKCVVLWVDCCCVEALSALFGHVTFWPFWTVSIFVNYGARYSKYFTFSISSLWFVILRWRAILSVDIYAQGKYWLNATGIIYLMKNWWNLFNIKKQYSIYLNINRYSKVGNRLGILRPQFWSLTPKLITTYKQIHKIYKQNLQLYG